MNISRRLSGGDLQSIGASNAVVSDALRGRALPRQLVRALEHQDPIVRARAADALEKITAKRPDWLVPHKHALLRAMTRTQQEVRWHVAQILPRIPLSPAEQKKAVKWLLDRLQDESRITRACALTSLVEMADEDATLRPRVRKIVLRLMRSPAASTRARAKRLSRAYVSDW